MRVVNLVAWAGADFSYLPGEVLELPDEVATARIEAGVAAPAEELAPADTGLAKAKK